MSDDDATDEPTALTEPGYSPPTLDNMSPILVDGLRYLVNQYGHAGVAHCLHLLAETSIDEG